MPFYYTFRGEDEETRRIARDFLALNVCFGFDVDGVVLRSAEVGSGQDPLRLPNR